MTTAVARIDRTPTHNDLEIARFVHRALFDVEDAGRYGDRKVFIASLWTKMLDTAEFTRWRSPKPVDRDHRKRSMAITENGPSRSVVRPVRVQIPGRSPGDQRVP